MVPRGAGRVFTTTLQMQQWDSSIMSETGASINSWGYGLGGVPSTRYNLLTAVHVCVSDMINNHVCYMY